MRIQTIAVIFSLVMSITAVSPAFGRAETAARPGMEGRSGQLVKLRMIVLKNREDAQGVLAALEGGASFAKLAREISVGPNAGRGGHIGTVDVNRLKPELREALKGLKAGEHTGPVETALGYAIFQVTTDEYYERGLGLFDMERYQEAIEEFKQDLKLNPDSAFSYFYLGLSQNKLNLNEEAAASLEEAARLEPDLTETYYNLGRVYTSLGRSSEAEKAYLKTIEKTPDFHMAHNNLALILMKDRKRIDKAIEHAKKAVELAASNAAYYHTLAMVYREAGNQKEAIKSLQMAIRLAPEDGFYKEQLASLESPPSEKIEASPGPVKEATAPSPKEGAEKGPPAVKPISQKPAIEPPAPGAAPPPSEQVARTVPGETEVKVIDRTGLRIKLLNGNGIQGAATQFAETLKKMNYRVEETGNADSFDWARTTIYYRENKKQEALELAHKIPGDQDVFMLKNHQPFDIVIILGME